MSQKIQHVFIIGAKGFVYGGYETFLDRLTEYHQNCKEIQYHIACKANGRGTTDETMLPGVERISDTEYTYHNAHCFKIKSPDLGSAQAILYDIKALQYCCRYIKKHQIKQPIVYVLSSRVGPFMGYFVKKIHGFDGKYFNNPDGRESLRKRQRFVQKYWALSERGMVKYSDLVICDSVHIEKYIQEEYKEYHPKTTYIAYGSDVQKSVLADDDAAYTEWLEKHQLKPQQYYLSVGRFIPENNFETMIREFMKSRTKKDFAVITNQNEQFLEELDQKLHFRTDSRIKFVGTVYDKELLKKIRENAYGYFHGHEVGGTNPSLLEALGSTDLNLLYDVGFNREVAEDAAVYWKKDEGNLAELIDRADSFNSEDIKKLGEKARQRIKRWYSWEFIAEQYRKVFRIGENT